MSWTRIGQIVKRSAGRNQASYALCRCECGHETTKRVFATTGLPMGDGCHKCAARRRTKHGHTRRGERKVPYTSTYQAWTAMLTRCENPRFTSFKDYGGRGIRVCAGWHDFTRFLADMGERPTGLSLDRIDNERGYDCGRCDDCKVRGAMLNCRWATPLEQARNSRHCHKLTINGVTKIISEWAEHVGLDPKLVTCRLLRGWSPERAVFTPSGRQVSATS